MDYSEEYTTLLRHMVTVTNSLVGKPLGNEPWFKYAEGVSMKLLAHTSAAYVLYQGTRLKYDDRSMLNFVDYSSITVLTRAALETFLAFYFIFCDAPTVDEKRFRFWCWDFAGFIDRQGFPIFSDEGVQLLEVEAAMLSEAKLKIESHQIFRAMTVKQQKKIIEEGQWRLGLSWSAIAVRAGFERNYFKGIYSHFCGYAHTNRLSIAQIQQATNPSIQRELAEASLGFCMVTMANFLFAYASLFPLADQAFKGDSKAYETALVWREISQNIHKDIKVIS